MAQTDEKLLEQTIEIAAPPEAVWALVSDLPRMASWSPQVVRTFVRKPIELGRRAINLNRSGWKVWPTRSEVIRFDPPRELAFKVKDNRAVWSYTLEPTATGTRVLLRREAPRGLSAASARLQDLVLGGQTRFDGEVHAGMRTTLERIKAEAES